MLGFLAHQAVDVGHIAGGDGDAALAGFGIEGDVFAPFVGIDITGTVDHDSPTVGAVVGSVQTFQPQAGLVPFPTVHRDLESAYGRALAPGRVAENRRLIGTSFPRPMHGISGIHHSVLTERPDEQPGLPALDAVVEEEAVVLAQTLLCCVFEGFRGAGFHLREVRVPGDAVRGEEVGTVD